MTDTTFIDRVSRLVEVRIAERRDQVQREATAIASRMNARGVLMSSMHVFELQQLYSRELDVRAIIVWETIVRVHRTLAASTGEDARGALKQLFFEYLGKIHAELLAQLVEGASRFCGGMKVELADSYQLTRQKHDVEIDLYFDSLASSAATGAPASTNYNFYGNVGAFQTGAHSIANVVQSLAQADREALNSALRQMADALTSTSSLPDNQRRELSEIAVECQQQLQSPTPNNTKLLTMFNVLATAAQGIASAQPAYQALRLALLPLGITLP